MILILSTTKIFDKVYACNMVCGLELAFPYLLCQNAHKNRMFLRFVSQKSIFAYYFVYIVSDCEVSKISRARLHYDVIVMSYVDGWCFFGFN